MTVLFHFSGFHGSASMFVPFGDVAAKALAPVTYAEIAAGCRGYMQRSSMYSTDLL